MTRFHKTLLSAIGLALALVAFGCALSLHRPPSRADAADSSRASPLCGLWKASS